MKNQTMIERIQRSARIGRASRGFCMALAVLLSMNPFYTSHADTTQPPPGPVPVIRPTLVWRPPNLQFQSALEEPLAPRPPHPPLETLPPVPMLTPSMAAAAANASAGPGAFIIYDAKTQSASELPASPAPAGQPVSSQGGAYQGADGGGGTELLPANFGTMSYLSPATRATYPYRVNCKLAMHWVDNGGGDAWFVASGTMVDPETVISAGHCVYNRDSNFSNNPWAVEVFVYPAWDGGNSLIPPSSTMYPYGYGRGTFYAALTAYTSGGDANYDLSVIKIDRAVGFLTGWYGWEYGFNCLANIYYNGSYPAQHCGSPGLHTGTDMYFWTGRWDACNGNVGTMWQLNTTPGCFTAVWGGMSGSSAYRNDSGNRYIGAVCSLSDRANIGLYASFYRGWVDYVWNTFIPTYSRGRTFDLQVLNQQLGVTSVPAGGTVTDLTHLAANPTMVDLGSRNYGFGVYLSSNDYISTGDTPLGGYTYTWDFAPVSAVTIAIGDVVIPANTPPGDYWIGVILDSSADSVPGNNNMVGWDARHITVTCASVPAAPSGVAASDGAYCGQVLLRWDSVCGATGYHLYRDGSFIGSHDATIIGNTHSLFLWDTPGDTSIHSYSVRSTYNGGTSSASSADNGYAAGPPAAPTGVSATDGTYCGVVQISWNASPGANEYYVYRDGSLIDIVRASPAHDNWGGFSTHAYTVRARNGCGSSGMSLADTGSAGNCAHLVVDNADGDPYVQASGNWSNSTASPGYWGPDYLHDGNTDKLRKAYTFIPTVGTSGAYQVFIWYTAAANRASNLEVVISHVGATAKVIVDERINGSQWVLLGTYTFEAGRNGYVTLYPAGADGYVIADAIKLVAGTPVAHLLVDNADGPTRFQTVGSWTSSTASSGYWGTDYLHNVNTGGGSETAAVFTPSIVSAGTYAVYIWYTAAANRASNLPVDIVCDGGSATVTVNERINGSQWVLLGTYSFAAGNSGHVTLRATATDGYVIADAIKLVASPPSHLVVDNADGPSFVTTVGDWTTSTGSSGYWGADYIHDGNTGKGTKSVTFTPAVPVTGSYQVFIWFTAAADSANNLPVDIVYNGGTTTVTVNERINDTTWASAWVYLGTYNFLAGTTGHVTLRTTGTDGYVIADVIKLQ